MESAETKTVENQVEDEGKSESLEAARVRNHPLFTKLTKELKTYQSKMEKSEAEKAEKEKQMLVNSELEKGNFEAARKELERQYTLEKQSIAAEKDALAKALQMERASTKLVANGVTSEKVAAFIANEYFALPEDDRPELGEWISKAKESDEFAPFFKTASMTAPLAPKDRAGVSVARGGGGEASKYKEILTNPQKFKTEEVSAAIKWRSNYVAVNGKLP